MLREEHMDLFGAVDATNKTYSASASIAAAVTGNVITIDPTIPNWDAKVLCTQAAVGTGNNINIVVKAANEIASNGAALVNEVTLANVAVANSALVLGKTIYSNVLPKGYKHFQFNLANNGAFTAGKVAGVCFPEFN